MDEFKSEVFNFLTTIGPKFLLPVGKSRQQQSWQKCICVCGTIKNIRCSSLGKTKSCGCMQKSLASKRQFKHGHSGTTEYDSWCKMKQRCTNPKNAKYPLYGGRGIKVCERWLDAENGINNFIEDMGKKPSKQHTIDRIDNNGDYEPSNCRWATTKEQARNTRTNLILNYNGQEKCAAEWCEELNIHPGTLFNRLKSGLSVEEALSKPVKKGRYTKK